MMMMMMMMVMMINVDDNDGDGDDDDDDDDDDDVSLTHLPGCSLSFLRTLWLRQRSSVMSKVLRPVAAYGPRRTPLHPSLSRLSSAATSSLSAGSVITASRAALRSRSCVVLYQRPVLDRIFACTISPWFKQETLSCVPSFRHGHDTGCVHEADSVQALTSYLHKKI
jgi:hypothetical protein